MLDESFSAPAPVAEPSTASEDPGSRILVFATSQDKDADGMLRLLVPMFGIAFSLVPSAMWPAVALIVEEKRLGTILIEMGALTQEGLQPIFG